MRHYLQRAADESALLWLLDKAHREMHEVVSVLPAPEGGYMVMLRARDGSRVPGCATQIGTFNFVPYTPPHHIKPWGKSATTTYDLTPGSCVMRAGAKLIIGSDGSATFDAEVMTSAREPRSCHRGPDIWHQELDFVLDDGSMPTSLRFPFDGPPMPHGNPAWHPFQHAFTYDQRYLPLIASVVWTGCC